MKSSGMTLCKVDIDGCNQTSISENPSDRNLAWSLDGKKAQKLGNYSLERVIKTSTNRQGR